MASVHHVRLNDYLADSFREEVVARLVLFWDTHASLTTVIASMEGRKKEIRDQGVNTGATITKLVDDNCAIMSKFCYSRYGRWWGGRWTYRTGSRRTYNWHWLPSTTLWVSYRGWQWVQVMRSLSPWSSEWPAMSSLKFTCNSNTRLKWKICKRM